MSSCPGCFPTYQANQLAHVIPDGCMYDPKSEEYCQPIGLSATHDDSDNESVWETDSESDEPLEAEEQEQSPIASSFVASDDTECCICLETIGEKNNCVTECGHKFCLKCLMTAMSRNNNCPMCRTQLVEDLEDSDDEDEEGDHEDDDEEEEEDEEENEPDVEEYVERFEKAGMTMLDVVSLWLGQFSKKNDKYTDEYIEKLGEDASRIMDDIEREHDERTQMADEDSLPEAEVEQLTVVEVA